MGRTIALSYAYYAGCSVQSSTQESDNSLRSVAKKLGVKLVELPEASCCGAREVKHVNYDFYIVLNARTLSMAEAKGLDILTECNTCLLNLIQVNRRLKEDSILLAKVNRVLSKIGLNYGLTVNVKHFLWALVSDIGLDVLSSKVINTLRGLKVAPFYGCHILRPRSDLIFENSDKPDSLERVITALGADPVGYAGRTKCCAFHTLPYNERSSLLIIGQRLTEAKETGADCLVTPCPLCHTALDVFQEDAERAIRQKIRLPVLHLSQLIGIALGVSMEDLMLGRHAISTKQVLKRIRAQ